jgi:starch phosphorylase
MKCSKNGALTICILDGANMEISQKVGAENFFLFVLTAEEVSACRAFSSRGRANMTSITMSGCAICGTGTNVRKLRKSRLNEESHDHH